jgi:hypothetical protein
MSRLRVHPENHPIEGNGQQKRSRYEWLCANIEGLAVKNNEFRRVLYTAKHCQLVVMALKPKEEIGAEVHKLDQFLWARN